MPVLRGATDARAVRIRPRGGVRADFRCVGGVRERSGRRIPLNTRSFTRARHAKFRHDFSRVRGECTDSTTDGSVVSSSRPGRAVQRSRKRRAAILPAEHQTLRRPRTDSRTTVRRQRVSHPFRLVVGD